MAGQWSQVVGEDRWYEQDVQGDTIATVQWAVDPPNTLSSPQQSSNATQVLVSTPEQGSFLLSVTINTVGGQVLVGQAKLDVIARRV